MSNQTFSNGRGYLTLSPYRTTPNERIRVSISENFVTGSEGLRELAAFLREQAEALEPTPAPAKKAPKRGKAKAAAPTEEEVVTAVAQAIASIPQE